MKRKKKVPFIEKPILREDELGSSRETISEREILYEIEKASLRGEEHPRPSFRAEEEGIYDTSRIEEEESQRPPYRTIGSGFQGEEKFTQPIFDEEEESEGKLPKKTTKAKKTNKKKAA